MGLRLAICQYASTDEVDTNLDRIRNAVGSLDADLFLFPELFLTRYGSGLFDTKDAEEVLSGIAKERDVAIAVGMPIREGNRLFNSLALFLPDRTVRYDKLYLANFAPYNEDVFTPGKAPVMAEWKGVMIGLEVCYDVMFPELHRHYARKGAQLILVSSASAEKSRPAMETIVPARSLENTVYTAFCNNIGNGPAGPFYGGSALFTPLGKKPEQLGNYEGVLLADISEDEIAEARKIRHHLDDLRDDIDWS